MIPKGRISKNNVLLQWSSLPMYLDGKYPRDEDLLVYRRGFYFVLEGRSYDIEDDLQEEGILHLKLGNILATGRKLDPHDLFDSVILEQFIHSNIDSLRVSAHQGTCKKTHRGVALIGTRPQRQCPEILTFGSIQD